MTTTKALDLAGQVSLGAEAKALLTETLSSAEFAERLGQAQLYPDALRMLAHSLPVREAIWWGCLCLWHSRQPPAGVEQEAFRAAVRWVQAPGEAPRRAAGKAGEAAGMNTAAGCLAKSAFYNSGSITPPGLPEVKPPPGLATKTVAVAVVLAANQGGPACPRDFLQLGLEVVQEKHRWDSK